MCVHCAATRRRSAAKYGIAVFNASGWSDTMPRPRSLFRNVTASRPPASTSSARNPPIGAFRAKGCRRRASTSSITIDRPSPEPGLVCQGACRALRPGRVAPATGPDRRRRRDPHHRRAAGAALRNDLDADPHLGPLAGVVDEVADHFLEVLAFAAEPHLRRRVEIDGDAARLVDLLHGPGERGDHRHYLGTLPTTLRRAASRARSR